METFDTLVQCSTSDSSFISCRHFHGHLHPTLSVSDPPNTAQLPKCNSSFSGNLRIAQDDFIMANSWDRLFLLTHGRKCRGTDTLVFSELPSRKTSFELFDESANVLRSESQCDRISSDRKSRTISSISSKVLFLTSGR